MLRAVEEESVGTACIEVGCPELGSKEGVVYIQGTPVLKERGEV